VSLAAAGVIDAVPAAAGVAAEALVAVAVVFELEEVSAVVAEVVAEVSAAELAAMVSFLPQPARATERAIKLSKSVRDEEFMFAIVHNFECIARMQRNLRDFRKGIYGLDPMSSIAPAGSAEARCGGPAADSPTSALR
jgi:hypothetical protein